VSRVPGKDTQPQKVVCRARAQPGDKKGPQAQAQVKGRDQTTLRTIGPSPSC